MNKLINLTKLIKSKDGSHSIYRSDIDEHYHSIHGAIQESKHVFINAGLLDHINATKKNKISILEIGFGTGLNAFLTSVFIKKAEINCIVEYHTLEPYPLPNDLIEQLNYPNSIDEKEEFLNLHSSSWENRAKIHQHFYLIKNKLKLEDYSTNLQFDIIYYDAFGPNSQKEMWEPKQFNKLFDLTKKNGRLVTYCAKGQVRRDLQNAGYQIQRLAGPVGKREMLRAIKL